MRNTVGVFTSNKTRAKRRKSLLQGHWICSAFLRVSCNVESVLYKKNPSYWDYYIPYMRYSWPFHWYASSLNLLINIHGLTVVCETKWSETKWNETKWNETKWKSVVCEMKICSSFRFVSFRFANFSKPHTCSRSKLLTSVEGCCEN